jgi:hypothetical protein
MTQQNQWPSDLALAVISALPKLDAPEMAIRVLFETMYFASMRTEEGSAIAFHIVYLDPENPDPKPPKRILQDRWTHVPFGDRLPFRQLLSSLMLPTLVHRLSLYITIKVEICLFGD